MGMLVAVAGGLQQLTCVRCSTVGADGTLASIFLLVQEQEYQVLSDLPGAVEGLGQEHALTPSMRQQWEQCRLSSACVAPDVVDDSLIFWRDAMSPYSLVRFGDLAGRGAPQVNSLRVMAPFCT